MTEGKAASRLVSTVQRCIRLYQLVVSPDHGLMRALFPYGACRYTPTCSEYALEALQCYGLKGMVMGIKRIGRCHPFTQGGYDPVVKKSV